jgi:hypothetical protein
MRLLICLAVLLALPLARGFAQVSLGDLARQQRAEKTTSSTKVFTNDNLKSGAPAFSNAPSAPASGGAKGASKNDAAASGSQGSSVDVYREKERSFRASYAAQKREVERLTRQLNVTQHEYDYQTSQYWGDAGTRLRENTTWTEKRQHYESEIAETTKRLNAAQEKLSGIEDDARRSGLSENVLDRPIGPDTGLVP